MSIKANKRYTAYPPLNIIKYVQNQCFSRHKGEGLTKHSHFIPILH